LKDAEPSSRIFVFDSA